MKLQPDEVIQESAMKLPLFAKATTQIKERGKQQL
jgi:hypothetical protein